MPVPTTVELAGPICETGCDGLFDALLVHLLTLLVLAVAWWLAFFVPAVVAIPWLWPGMSKLGARMVWAVLSSVAAFVAAPVAIAAGGPVAALLPLAWWATMAVHVHRRRAGGPR